MQTVEAMLSSQMAMLETAKLRWMSGGDAETADNALANGQATTEAQLRLLAQAGQVMQVCMVPERPAGLEFAAPLPKFDLPLLPENLRPLFRRLVKAGQGGPWRGEMIALMAARGVAAHPFDWLPSKDASDLPSVYAPLQAWVNGQSTLRETGSITAENWDLFLPRDRQQAVADLRKADPAAGLALLAAKAATTPAEERARLIGLLGDRLSLTDQAYLDSLSTDRSTKVRDISRHLLARLGVVESGEDAQELADFIEVKKALLTRKPSFAPKAKLNHAQKSRMQTLLGIVPVGDLTSALGYCVADLAKGWTFADEALNWGLFQAFCNTAADADLGVFWARTKTEGAVHISVLSAIAPRLSRAELVTDCADMLKSGKLVHIAGLAALLGADVPDLLARAVLEAKTIRDVLAKAQKAANERDSTTPHAIAQAQSLILGLAALLPRPYAQKLYDQVAGSIFHTADPALDPLLFNILLEGPNP